MRRHVGAGVLATAIAAWVAPAAASEPWPAFSVVAPDGQRMSSVSIVETSPTLVVYVEPGNPAAVRLFEAFDAWQLQGLDERVVVVVAGPLAGAREFMTRGPLGGHEFVWVADDRDEARQALAPAGSPTLFGVEGGQVAWRVAGVLNEPRMIEELVRAWVEQR